MTELEQNFQQQQDDLIDTKSKLYELQKAHDNLKKQFFEAGERYKTNLRAIYFLLTELQNVGTHHEKEVVIRYIKGVINRHIETPIAYYPDSSELPF